MLFLCKFLYRNLKGFRFLILLAILLTIAQVGCDLLAAMPLKFIPSKINNPGSDPVCTIPFLDPILDKFDTPLLDSSLKPLPSDPPGTVVQPPTAQCPVSSTDPNAAAQLKQTHH